MRNDLTRFEKNLLNQINFLNNTKFTYKHLMEWGSSKNIVEKNLIDGEVIYESLGMFVAIKPENKKP